MNWTHWYEGDRVHVHHYGPLDDNGDRYVVIENESPRPVRLGRADDAPLVPGMMQFAVVRESELTPL